MFVGQVAAGRLEFPVPGLACRRECQQPSRRIRIDDVRVRSIPMQIGSLEKEEAAETLVPRDRLDDAFRCLERGADRVCEGDGGPEWSAAGVKINDRPP